MQVRRGQTRAFKVKKRASKACADAGDSGEDACKHGVRRRGRSRCRRVQARCVQPWASPSVACADAGDHKACADAGDQGADVCKQGVSDAGDPQTRYKLPKYNTKRAPTFDKWEDEKG